MHARCGQASHPNTHAQIHTKAPVSWRRAEDTLLVHTDPRKHAKPAQLASRAATMKLV